MRGVNWSGIARGYVDMERKSIAHFLDSPRFDRGHYQEQERMYRDWLSGLKRSGIDAPNLMIAATMWLGGVAFVALLPRSWVRVFVIATIAYVLRYLTLVDTAPASERSEQ